MLSFLSGLVSWGNGILLALVFSAGLTTGTWVGHKFFSEKVPWKKLEVKYQLPSKEIVRGQAISLDGVVYYPVPFVNGWLKDKAKSNARLK